MSGERQANRTAVRWPEKGEGEAGGARRPRRQRARQRPEAAGKQSHKYWPVFATVSMDRPASLPLLPETRVLM